MTKSTTRCSPLQLRSCRTLYSPCTSQPVECGRHSAFELHRADAAGGILVGRLAKCRPILATPPVNGYLGDSFQITDNPVVRTADINSCCELIRRRTCPMNMTDSNSIPDDADIAQIFLENDDLAADSSLWFRSLRQLLKEGKPTGAMTLLAFRDGDASAYPFGVLTHTKNDRVVFWLVLPTNADMVAAEGKIGVIDHVTLELPNEKTHVTAYDSGGDALQYGAADFGHLQAWRLQRFEGTGLSIWFTLLVKWSILAAQETVVQRRMQAPTPADVERRKQAFARHAAQIKVIDVPVPQGENASDYVLLRCLLGY